MKWLHTTKNTHHDFMWPWQVFMVCHLDLLQADMGIKYYKWTKIKLAYMWAISYFWCKYVKLLLTDMLKQLFHSKSPAWLSEKINMTGSSYWKTFPSPPIHVIDHVINPLSHPAIPIWLLWQLSCRHHEFWRILCRCR